MNPDHEIETRQLGRTGIQVTPIGLGVMQFAGSKFLFGGYFHDIPQEQMNAITQAALDGGINWFDTAEMYGRGLSERRLANALHAADVKDDQVIVATKWLPLLRTAGNISKTIDDRLKFLDGYSIDLYMVHQPWSFSSPEVEMEAMADLVAAGKVRSIGVSNFDVERMRRSHAALEKRGLPLAVNQVQYSLFNREIETDGTLEAARELGVTVVAWSPLGRGILTGKFHKDPRALAQTPYGRRGFLRRQLERTRPLVEALEEIGNGYGATPTQIALNWVIHFQGESVVAIPGGSRVHHAEEAAGAMRFRLSEEEMERLDLLSRDFR